MPNAVADNYTKPISGALYAGRLKPSVSANTVLIGDSLTAFSYGELHPFNMQNGLNGGKLKVVGNIGVANNTVQNLLDRIDNAYTASPPGLGGMGVLGWAYLRVGTNNTRGGSTINGSDQTAYANLITKILTYVDRVIVMAVPPVGPPESGAGVASYNSWLAAYCAGNSRTHFIDDTTGVNNGSGGWVSGFAPPDGIHMQAKPINQMGLDGATAFGSVIASQNYPSPLITSALDVYPANPQWVVNPLMSGTGSVPTSWTISTYGTGYSTASEIVAADITDPNQTPWLRVTPASIGDGNSALRVNATLSGRSITALDPVALEAVAEVRLNALNGDKFKHLSMSVYGNENEYITPNAAIRLANGVISRVFVNRVAIPRHNTKVASASAILQFSLSPIASYTGAMGSFDIRCASVRG